MDHPHRLSATLSACFCLVIHGAAWAEETRVTQWTPHVLLFEAGEDYEWRAFPILATFTHEATGHTVPLDAYWDGGRTWCVRFSPTAPGVWNYRTASKDASLDGRTGKIQCVAPSEDAVQSNLNLRGQVRAVPGGRHFSYADGTPFLGLAEQFWDFNIASRMPLADVDTYLADRSAKGFNIVQIRYTHVGEANEGGLPFPGNTGGGHGNGDFSAISADHFRALDQRFDKCFHAGFVVAGHPLWIGYDTRISVEDAKLLQRYLLARYGPYNIIWSLSGEFDKAFNAQRGGKVKWRDEPQVKGIGVGVPRAAWQPRRPCQPQLVRPVRATRPGGVSEHVG